MLMLVLSMPSWANHLPEDVEQATNVNDIALPLTEHSAAELAHIETGGKILSVEQTQENDQIIFRVKVLHQNGKVKVHRFDGETGHAIH